MSERIDQFCESLRVKLTEIEGNFAKMREGVHTSISGAEAEVRKSRDAVAAEIIAAQAEVADARSAAGKWVEAANSTSAETVASWKSSADAKHLALRADAAEAYPRQPVQPQKPQCGPNPPRDRHMVPVFAALQSRSEPRLSGHCYAIPCRPMIEMAFSKLKALIRKAAARTYEDLWQAVGRVCGLFSDEECYNFFRAAGYEAN